MKNTYFSLESEMVPLHMNLELLLERAEPKVMLVILLQLLEDVNRHRVDEHLIDVIAASFSSNFAYK